MRTKTKQLLTRGIYIKKCINTCVRERVYAEGKERMAVTGAWTSALYPVTIIVYCVKKRAREVRKW